MMARIGFGAAVILLAVVLFFSGQQVVEAAVLPTIYTTHDIGKDDLGPYNLETIQMGYDADFGYGEARAALKFTLPVVSGEVADAKLRLYIRSVDSGAFLNIYSSSVDTWDESETSFPTYNTGDLITTRSDFTGTTSTWVEFDVTSFVNQEEQGDGVVTFVLTGTTSGSTSFVHSYAKEDASSRGPQLVITQNQAPTGSVAIDNGDAYTTNSSVALSLTASDADGNSLEMRFSNNNSTWSSWEPYSTTKSWTLTGGDGEKTVYVQISDTYDSVVELSDTIILDSNPPIVTGVTDGGLYNADRQIFFDSGTATLNGSPFDTGDTVSQEDNYTLVVTEGSGNTATVSFEIDKTAPAVTGVIDGGEYNTNVTISYDDGTALLDGQSFASGSEVSVEGSYTLVVTDAAGNATTVSFEIDQTAPVVTGVVDGGLYNEDQTVSFDDGTATLNAVAFMSGSVVSSEGTHTLIVTDAAGNTTTVSFEIDKTAPVVTGVVDGEAYNTNVTISYDDGTALLEGQPFASGGEVSGEGSHTLVVTDAAGNSATVSFEIDKTAPIVTGVADGGLYNEDQAVSFNEGTATLNGLDFVNGNVVSEERTHSLVVTDRAGNSVVVSFTLDLTPPVITLDGELSLVLAVGTPYVEAGYHAADNHDGDRTAYVTVTGDVYDQQIGEYSLHYQVLDRAGNAAAQVTRTVRVVSDNANVSSIELRPNILGTDFASDQLEYSMSVRHEIHEVTLAVHTEDAQAAIAVRGDLVLSGEEKTVSLAYGTNVIEITVTAPSGNEKVYILRIERTSAPVTPDEPEEDNEDKDKDINQIDIIDRSKDASGTVIDTIKFDLSAALASVSNAGADEEKMITLFVPNNTEVNELHFQLEKESLSMLAKEGLQVQLDMEYLQILLPEETVGSMDEELYFRIVPLRQDEQRIGTISRLEQQEELQELVEGQPYSIFGDSLIIETNLSGKQVDLRIPIDVQLIPEGISLEDYVDRLVVYIEHSDGDKVLQKGTIVTDKNGSVMLEFTVYKFSTFTLLHLEGEEESGPEVSVPYIMGYSDGTFRPNQGITRAEMASLLARVLELEPNSHSFHYADVPIAHWAVSSIEKVHALGLMTADEQGEFRPEDDITRAEMAMIMSRWLQLSMNEAEAVSFTDVPEGHWALQAIAHVRNAGIMIGYEDGTFRPSKDLTRAEAVTLMNKALGLEALNSTALPSFNDVTADHWAYGHIEAASASR
jgi:hypothetical protein